MDYFEKLLQENQNDISVLNALGNTQQANGNFLSALENYNKAIAINANIAHIHFNRGITLQSLEKHRDATISYLQATNLKPNYTMAYFNCGVALEKLGEIDQALVFFDKVLQLDARSSRAYFHKACIYAQQADYEQAELLYQQAITYNSDEFDARWNLSLLLLRRGDFCQGWRGYEARLQLGSSNSKPPPSTRQSLPWLGDAKNLATKTIILWHEQGMGDTLQFCRYASLVADLGGSVQLLVPSSLVTLLQNMDKRIAVKASDSSLAVDVHADLHCPLMSLPLVCGTDSTYKIPNRVPYVVCDASLSHIWNEKLKERLGATRKRRVGLVWASGYRPDRPDLMSFTKLRDLPLAKFFALAHPNVDFISLQKGEHAEQELTSLIQQGWTGPAIENYGNELIDFSDTAALIDNLDLVISVDTSVAHLAGAMGKPVWILNCFDACWRWLYGQDPKRTDSPWYPSARLFRQSKVGDWDSVIDKVREALTDFAAQSLN
jgi:Tfp pilus assembly protein PilF